MQKAVERRRELKDDEVMLGRKTIFYIPFDSKITFEDVRIALLKEYGREDVDRVFRRYDEDFPYIYSIMNAFQHYKEVTIKAKPIDAFRISKITRLFERAFNCKLPYGSEGVMIKDKGGRTLIEVRLTK